LPSVSTNVGVAGRLNVSRYFASSWFMKSKGSLRGGKMAVLVVPQVAILCLERVAKQQSFVTWWERHVHRA
jgi:hypothetical protein